MNDTILRLVQRYLKAEMDVQRTPTVEVYAMRRQLWNLVKDLKSTSTSTSDSLTP